MITISARGVNDAYVMGMELLHEEYAGKRFLETRAGTVIRAPGPVTTYYSRPWERVLFDPVRDCNPFFHLMEALWMLDGRNDVAFPTTFNSRFGQFSDDGETYWGAYGYRWRHYFGYDQIAEIIHRLKEAPNDRRIVLGIWDPAKDLKADSKDIPCNDTVKFDIRDDLLNMYVFNRSNDAIWGCYGSNAVHFSLLQECIAAHVGVGIGGYWQISCDFHAYVPIYEKKYYEELGAEIHESPYSYVSTIPLVSSAEHFFPELALFMSGMVTEETAFDNEFFPAVALPMRHAWHAWKRGYKHEAIIYLSLEMSNCDWKKACLEWMGRRVEA